MINRKQLAQIELANEHPLNQAAATFLKQTDWRLSADSLHTLTLIRWALGNGLRVRSIAEPGAYLLDLQDHLGPMRLTKLIAGEVSPDEANLTAAELLAEETPLDAAMLLLDSLLANRQASL